MSQVDQALPYVRAISPYQPGKPIEELAREFGGSKSTHDRYRQQVCQELDRWYRRAIAMCRHEDVDQVHLND